MRALGFGQVGCFGLLEGVLIAQIISLTVALKTLPQSVFFDIISTQKICITIIYAVIKIE